MRLASLSEQPHPLDPVRIPHAKELQRRGLTFTEIARQMRVERQAVVDALYWEVRE